MKISPRNLLIAAAAAVLLVAVILVVLLIVPEYGKLTDIESQATQSEDQIQQAQTLLDRRQESKQRASMTTAELLRLSAAVPETPELPSLIIELQSLTIASGLQFRMLTPQPPVAAWQTGAGPSPNYLKTPMSMQVIGEWSDTVDFLQRLQKLPRQLRITSIKSTYLETEPTNPPDPMPKVPVQTDLTIEAYVLPSAGSTVTPAPATTN